MCRLRHTLMLRLARHLNFRRWDGNPAVYRVEALTADATAATHFRCYVHHRNLLRSPRICTIVFGTIVWIVTPSGLRMQQRRRKKSASPTAEKAFGVILRDIRKERGLSQETLAVESGHHPSYIGQMERGQKSPSLRTIMNLAGALRTPGSEMLRRIEARLGGTVPQKRQR
jgi:DNA-binding XRE family transcriptional regulator